MSVRFEWHVAKADDNFREHHVAFDEAATVFRDSLAAIFADETHSSTEHRELIIGHSVLGRLLIVSFTETPGGAVRIISARRATRTERREYEENRDR